MGYNRFLLKKDLYGAFKSFSFLTICQPDAVLIKDISKINLRSLDYIGAPWKKSYKLDIFGIYGLNFISKFFFNLFKKNLLVGNGVCCPSCSGVGSIWGNGCPWGGRTVCS